MLVSSVDREREFMTGLHDFSATAIDGTERSLADFKGQVVLVVNVASRCGFTPQYRGLEALYEKYKPRGFAVLGFPCNQFGAQEPGNEAEIAAFCTTHYEVTFPMFAKVDVNGDRAHPLYRYLTSAAPGLLGTESIKWNFTKFLVRPDGQVVRRFAPNDAPDSLASHIEPLLKG
jgi:glutathione peroxidase